VVNRNSKSDIWRRVSAHEGTFCFTSTTMQCCIQRAHHYLYQMPPPRSAQPDGDLVVTTDTAANSTVQPLWQSGTGGAGSAYMQLSGSAAGPLCVYPAMAVSAELPAAAPTALYCSPPAKAVRARASSPAAAVASSVTVVLLVAAALTAAVLWRRKRRGASLCCCSARLLSKAPSARHSPKPNSLSMREWNDSARSLGAGRSGSHRDASSSGSSATAQLLRTGTSGTVAEAVPYSSSVGRASSMLLEDDVEQGCLNAATSSPTAATAALTAVSAAAALAGSGTVLGAYNEQLPAADSKLTATDQTAAVTKAAAVTDSTAVRSRSPAVALTALAPSDAAAAAAATSTASMAVSGSTAAASDVSDAATAANASTPRNARAVVTAVNTEDSDRASAADAAASTAAAGAASTTAPPAAAAATADAGLAAAQPKQQLRTFRAAASRLRATASRGITAALLQGEQHRAHIETAWDLAGAVASHLPYVRDAYGLCDEVVKLFSASTTISSNCAEVVAWALQMQVSQCTVKLTCCQDVM
jgi:hypothetical protein